MVRFSTMLRRPLSILESSRAVAPYSTCHANSTNPSHGRDTHSNRPKPRRRENTNCMRTRRGTHLQKRPSMRCRTEIVITGYSHKADLAQSNARIETCRAFEKSPKRASTSTDSRHPPPIAARPFPTPRSTQSWTQTGRRTVTDREVGAVFLENADDCHIWERSPHRIF